MTAPNTEKHLEKMEPSYIVGGNVKWCSHSGKQFWQFLKKLNIELPYDPAIPPLGIYPRELKTYVHTNTFTQMFIVVLSPIAKTETIQMFSNG